jgi:hypothetical protein
LSDNSLVNGSSLGIFCSPAFCSVRFSGPGFNFQSLPNKLKSAFIGRIPHLASVGDGQNVLGVSRGGIRSGRHLLDSSLD